MMMINYQDPTPEEIPQASMWLQMRFFDYDKRSFINHTDIRRYVYEKTNGRCFYCGKKLINGENSKRADGFAVDHYFPYGKYHNNNPFYLFPSCNSCNSEKNDMLVSKWHEYYCEKHGEEFLWYENAFYQLNIIDVLDVDLDKTGYIDFEPSLKFRDKMWFEPNTICCGRFNDIMDFVKAFPLFKNIDLTHAWKESTFSKNDCFNFLKEIYYNAKEKNPDLIPSIGFNDNFNPSI